MSHALGLVILPDPELITCVLAANDLSPVWAVLEAHYLATLGPTLHFGGWLVAAMRNMSITYSRKSRRRAP